MATNKKILLGLTTHRSDWESKLLEIEKLKLTEIALFLTALNEKERSIIYRRLEQSSIKKIPHVHLRSSMNYAETDYLAKKFKVEAFNIHPKKDYYPSNKDYKNYNKIIYVENTFFVPNEKELKNYAGLCIDFAHWENAKITKNKKYANFEKLANKHKTGCCHISAVGKVPHKYKKITVYDTHLFKNLDQLDYIKKYIKYMPNLISIELTNSFEEQLRVKKYLEEIITA